MKKTYTDISSGLFFKLILTVFFIGSSFHQGLTQVNEESQITALMDRWVAYNETHQELRGYRIQILASTDRRQAETVRKKFEDLYDEYPIHFIHNYPYYQLKVGAFMTMQKARAFLYTMQEEFPQAITVQDNLTMEELLEFD